MKRINLSTIAVGTILLTLTSCDAIWGTSMSYGPDDPTDYYYGWDGDWSPTLAGVPITSPYYYGGSAYPLGPWQPVAPPGTNSWGGPIYGGGNAPVITRPGGNVRPPQSSTPTPSVPSTPSTPVVPPAGTKLPNLNGSNPGIALPPAGSGYKYNGRH